MTCFWDGLIKGLGSRYLGSSDGRMWTPYKLCLHLIANNTITYDVQWNGVDLTQRELDMNYRTIAEFDAKSITNGYLCGACDPFICLVAQLCRVNIAYDFNGVHVHYTVKGFNQREKKRHIFFVASANHFKVDTRAKRTKCTKCTIRF